MSYNALASHNTLLQVGNGASPEVFTTISEIGDWDPPGFMRNTFKTTAQNDTTDTFISGGLMTTNEFTVQISYRPSDPTHDKNTGLIYAVRSGVRKNYRCLYPDASGLTFNAYIVDFQPKALNDGVLTAQVKFRPTGDITPF